jgi:phage I-like protein
MQKQDEKNMIATTSSAGVFIKPNVSSGSYDQVDRRAYNMAVSGSDAYTCLARSEAQIAITGTFDGHPQGDFTFSSGSFQQLQDNFYLSNQVIPVNYEHVSSSDGSNPAIGWITGVYTATGSAALYASIDWVDAVAVQEIRDGKYLYLSPTINFSAVDEKSGVDIGATLLSVALTNTPFLKGMESITVIEVSDSSYLDNKDNKMMYKNKEEVAMAEDVDSAESETEEKESMEMALSPEEQERATLLVDVMHVALVSALDAGLSVDSSTFSFELKEDGSVAVMGVDASGAELTHDISVDEIMAALEEHNS